MQLLFTPQVVDGHDHFFIQPFQGLGRSPGFL